MYNTTCSNPIPPQIHRKLTLLLLDCWQREYDKRPYRCFQLERLTLEERLDRKYDSKEDFSCIVSFLTKRLICTVKLAGLRVLSDDILIINDFVASLQEIKHIELKLMDLPMQFFRTLAHNATNMKAQSLCLEGTPLKDESICQLHSFIICSQTLSKLNVSSCSINQFDFAQLADAIHKSKNLTSCNLSHIESMHLSLDSAKIAHIIASLLWQNKLQELILENCGLIGHDMEIISEYLYNKFSKLLFLNVSYNKIGSNGASELFKAIASSGTLKHLNMNGCNLTTRGGEVVAKYLSSCWSLQLLELKHNEIDAEAINMILASMTKECNLQKLHVFGNLFNKLTGDTLRRFLDSGTLSENNLDVKVTFDDTIGGYRVIPL